jgi:hypothetical protein
MKTTLKKSTCKSRFLLALLSFVVCQSITMAQTSWNTNGNAGSFSNFIGTTNNFPFLFRTNNVERMRIQPNGFVGIGVANPLQRLDIFGNLRVRGNIYVDQNVYQQGEFASDSIDAGLIQASTLSAAKINTDSLKAYVILMDEMSKFVGTAKFEETAEFERYLKAKLGIEIGEETNTTNSTEPTDPDLKLEVKNGNARFRGNVLTEGESSFNGLARFASTGFKVGATESAVSFVQSGSSGAITITKPNFEIATNFSLLPNCSPETPSFVTSLQDGQEIFQVNTSDQVTRRIYTGLIGNDGHIDVTGQEVSGQGNRLLLNYICGKDVVVGSPNNGGNLFANNKMAIGFNTMPNGNEKLYVNGNIKSNGLVALGSINGQYLSIDGNSVLNGDLNTIGNIKTKKVIICADGWCDYVFDKKYKLKSLFEVEKFIEENKHLPGIPSAKEIENKEVDIFQIQKMQMEKIEELTLYIIELKKELDSLKK